MNEINISALLYSIFLVSNMASLYINLIVGCTHKSINKSIDHWFIAAINGLMIYIMLFMK